MKPIRSGRAVVAALLFAAGGALAEGRNLVGAGFALVPPLGDLEGSALMFEYERALTPGLALFARAMRIDWEYDDGYYEEEGDGSGVGVGLRYFPSGAGRGFYVGGSVGTFRSEWRWWEYPYRGSGKTTAMQLGGEVGYRFPLGDALSLTPAINFGSWVGADNSCHRSSGQSCDGESELGFYAVGSLVLGVRF